MTATRDGLNVAALRCDHAPRWKTIILGNYPNVFALRDALIERHVGIGDRAAEMLRLPTFKLSSPRHNIDLIIVAVGQLLPEHDSATFANIHAHALEADLHLCPPESVRNCAFNTRIRKSANSYL